MSEKKQNDDFSMTKQGKILLPLFYLVVESSSFYFFYAILHESLE